MHIHTIRFEKWGLSNENWNPRIVKGLKFCVFSFMSFFFVWFGVRVCIYIILFSMQLWKNAVSSSIARLFFVDPAAAAANVFVYIVRLRIIYFASFNSIDFVFKIFFKLFLWFFQYWNYRFFFQIESELSVFFIKIQTSDFNRQKINFQLFL